MSVNVVARIRPLLKAELEKDNILQVSTSSSSSDSTTTTSSSERPTVLRLPNPKNAAESYSFHFNSVYDRDSTQQEVFDNEIAPTVKHLFNGFDTTIFAYGVTGSGKTHTMRGAKSLADRGMIPRLLSGIYRRGRKVEKDSDGATKIEVSMSYYEIYNDRIYDLFEPPEKRTATGLPIRDNNGKTVIAGLTERPCTSLKEFELLYDSANVNRSTSATKLNAHSSRSHAILSVKVSQIHPTHTITSTASAIDLAGSEDNRRTGNDKERLVESSSINKSLFVLAQCVEAIAKKQSRIPYRESKMTRVLSLGQNQGLTIMILNLAPARSYHLDTLSSLNFANRTKKIEVREVENEPIARFMPVKKAAGCTTSLGPSMQRPPLRPIAANVALITPATASAAQHKPAKTFTVYTERSSLSKSTTGSTTSDTLKRSADPAHLPSNRPTKIIRTSTSNGDTARPQTQKQQDPELSRSDLENLINQLVDERLANRALVSNPSQETAPPASALDLDLKTRLEALEQRIERTKSTTSGDRAEGLQYLLMAKQHRARGEDASALRMYQLAVPFFPENEKLALRMVALQEKLRGKRAVPVGDITTSAGIGGMSGAAAAAAMTRTEISSRGGHDRKKRVSDADYHDPDPTFDDDNDAAISSSPSHDELSSSSIAKRHRKPINRRAVPKPQIAPPAPPPPPPPRSTKLDIFRDDHNADPFSNSHSHNHNHSHNHDNNNDTPTDAAKNSPRTSHLLSVINSRDATQIRQLKGLGAKKADLIVRFLMYDAQIEGDAEGDGEEEKEGQGQGRQQEHVVARTGMKVKKVKSLRELEQLKGLGARTLECMREGVGIGIGIGV